MSEVQPQESLTEAASAAVLTERETGLPASITLAQWAYESGWGAHSPGCNCFGIKAYAGCAGTQILQTAEWLKGTHVLIPQEFATFPSVMACFLHHATLITTGEPYRAVWGEFLSHRDPDALARALAPIYATDPKYPAILVELMHHSRITGALSAAVGESSAV